MTFLLFVHVFGAVVFLGNIITAAFWKYRADSGRNPVVIRHTVKNVMLADFLFTLPGILLLIISGNIMAAKSGIPMDGLNWLTLSLILFIITGVLWLAVLIPLQRAMVRHSADCVKSGGVSTAYSRASRRWMIFGNIATLLPVVILYLMVAKFF